MAQYEMSQNYVTQTKQLLKMIAMQWINLFMQAALKCLMVFIWYDVFDMSFPFIVFIQKRGFECFLMHIDAYLRIKFEVLMLIEVLTGWN